MIDFIVCDDNKMICKNIEEVIKNLCKKCDIEFSITLFNDYNKDFINYIKDKRNCIYILDIETPSLSGIEVAKIIRKYDYNSIIIFLTMHNELAYEVIRNRLNVLTLISKMVNYKYELSKSIELAFNYLNPDINIRFKDFSREYSISPKSILYVTKDGRKTSIVTDQNCYSVYVSMAKIEGLLPNYFVKSHRACIVNKNRIEKIDNKCINFDNGSVIDLVSDKYKKNICI